MKIIVDCEGVRIDVFLSDKLEITRSNAQKLIEQGDVLLDGKATAKNYKVRQGDVFEVIMSPPQRLNVTAENIPLDIVYEDNDIIVVNKPQGMVVHPAAGNYEGTLVNALMYHCGDDLSEINGVIRPGIIHRIDKDTSGLLVVAKNDFAHLKLSQQIKEHSFTREYVCLVNGGVSEDKFTVDAPIDRSKKDRKKMTVVKSGGRNAITHFEVLQRYVGCTLLKCVLETGRTHQIRVHLKYRGYTIVGDHVYGLKKDVLALKYNIKGQLLHARVLGFMHPVQNKYFQFEAPIPDYFSYILSKCDMK